MRYEFFEMDEGGRKGGGVRLFSNRSCFYMSVCVQRVRGNSSATHGEVWLNGKSRHNTASSRQGEVVILDAHYRTHVTQGNKRSAQRAHGRRLKPWEREDRTSAKTEPEE